MNLAANRSIDWYVRKEVIDALGEIAELSQALPAQALRVLLEIATCDSYDNSHVQDRAGAALKKIRSPDLALHPYDQVKCVCYLTNRAFIVTEHELSISDSRCKTAITKGSNQKEQCSVQ